MESSSPVSETALRRLGAWAPLWLLPLLMLVLIWILRTWVFGIFVVDSTSMAPALLSGERLLVNRLAYREAAPVPGDVVVFSANLPGEGEGFFVKRIIGVAGDEVEEGEGGIRVNGELWTQEPLAEVELSQNGLIQAPGLAPASLILMKEHSPFGSWLVLYSRERSREERGRGSQTQLEGREQGLERPFAGSREDGAFWQVRPGHLLVMGDNRNDSIDGRSLAGYGQIPVDAVIGRVSKVICNSRSEGNAEGNARKCWLRGVEQLPEGSIGG